MVDISNYVAQFGKRGTGNPGSGMAYGLQAQQMKQRNRLAELRRQDQAEQRNVLAQEKQRAEQQDYMRDVVQTLQSVDEKRRPQVWQGAMQGAAQRGWDITGDEQWSEDKLPRLQGMFGVAAPGAQGVPAAVQEQNALLAVLDDPNASKDQISAARIKLGLDPRAVGSSSLTIANTGKTDKVAGSEATIAGAKAGASEEAKLIEQGRHKPAIAAAIKSAEMEAQARGETLTKLNRAKAAMPGLEETVSSLKELAPLVTHTYAGRIFDTLAKEAGFGSTEGATARAQFTSIVSNQVLPLLRETFGAAFTAAEGQELKATMGDPNATPEQKVAQLDAFIAQKYRDIETGERELAEPAQDGGSVAELDSLRKELGL